MAYSKGGAGFEPALAINNIHTPTTILRKTFMMMIFLWMKAKSLSGYSECKGSQNVCLTFPWLLLMFLCLCLVSALNFPYNSVLLYKIILRTAILVISWVSDSTNRINIIIDLHVRQDNILTVVCSLCAYAVCVMCICLIWTFYCVHQQRLSSDVYWSLPSLMQGHEGLGKYIVQKCVCVCLYQFRSQITLSRRAPKRSDVHSCLCWPSGSHTWGGVNGLFFIL